MSSDFASDAFLMQQKIALEWLKEFYDSDTRTMRGFIHQWIGELQAENERLAAIVGKLPLTADGVPVVPCVDTVWDWRTTIGSRGKKTWVECQVEIAQPYNEAFYNYVDPKDVPKCYFTREAAEAAKQQPC